MNRVQQHLNGELIGKVFVVVCDCRLVAHTIVRVEENGCGLFSTIFVEPTYRRHSLASRLIESGENWFRTKNVTKMMTYTDDNNQKLVQLFEASGFEITTKFPKKKMIELSKGLR